MKNIFENCTGHDAPGLTPPIEPEAMEKKLRGLIAKWTQSARRAFYDAGLEQDPMGKRLIEHGAICYSNCATDLTEVLAFLLPEPSTIPKEDQR